MDAYLVHDHAFHISEDCTNLSPDKALKLKFFHNHWRKLKSDQMKHLSSSEADSKHLLFWNRKVKVQAADQGTMKQCNHILLRGFSLYCAHPRQDNGPVLHCRLGCECVHLVSPLRNKNCYFVGCKRSFSMCLKWKRSSRCAVTVSYIE